MSPNREKFFALGVALGTAVGFVLGSVLALRVGEEGIDSVRRAVTRSVGQNDHPKFEILLQ